MINSNSKKVFLLIVALLLSISGLFAAKKLKTKKLTIVRSDKSTVSLTAEMAVTEDEKSYGFMNRKSIPDGTGMLFVYNYDLIMSFWMKNTPHPLSIAYIDSKGKIRNIFDMTPYSLSTIVSTVSVRYALEVPQGWFEKNNIHEGDYLNLDF